MKDRGVPWLVLLAMLLLGPAVPRAAACPVHKRSQAVLRAYGPPQRGPGPGHTTGPCPQFLLDHRYPLCAGGTDTVANLVWQPKDLSYDKDRLERELCRLKCAGK
jgi:hypothetical protein